VYGEVIAALKARGGVSDFEHARDGVFVALDLGISDSFAMWWFRFGADRGVDVIDHYEAHGRTLQHYFDVLDSRGYQYRQIFLPHDARAHSLQTGQSIQERFLARYPGLASIGPELSIPDGLQAGRWLLEQPATRIHSRCRLVTGPEDIDGLDALAAYRYEYDEANKVYKKTPKHNWASHTADAFRYLACAVRFSEFVTRPKAPAAPKPLKAPTYNLDSLWNTAPKKSSRI
jgi:phage terminase large subunit